MEEKSFTLLELIVVILIIGILGTFGFVQYTQLLENGRKAEAYTNLGMLRKLQMAYYLEHKSYANNTLVLDAGLPGECNNASYYFAYYCNDPAAGPPYYCYAFRCTSGGKKPDATRIYFIQINLNNGTFLEGIGPPPPSDG